MAFPAESNSQPSYIPLLCTASSLLNQLRLENFSAFASFQIKSITKTHVQIYKMYHNI